MYVYSVIRAKSESGLYFKCKLIQMFSVFSFFKFQSKQREWS